jgi:hypothetical protein
MLLAHISPEGIITCERSPSLRDLGNSSKGGGVKVFENLEGDLTGQDRKGSIQISWGTCLASMESWLEQHIVRMPWRIRALLACIEELNKDHRVLTVSCSARGRASRDQRDRSADMMGIE